MNKIIKELALEAGGSHYPEVNSKQLEYFSELLIKECINVIMNNSDRYRKEYFAGLLKEHFDIK